MLKAPLIDPFYLGFAVAERDGKEDITGFAGHIPAHTDLAAFVLGTRLRKVGRKGPVIFILDDAVGEILGGDIGIQCLGLPPVGHSDIKIIAGNLHNIGNLRTERMVVGIGRMGIAEFGVFPVIIVKDGYHRFVGIVARCTRGEEVMTASTDKMGGSLAGEGRTAAFEMAGKKLP